MDGLTPANEDFRYVVIESRGVEERDSCGLVAKWPKDGKTEVRPFIAI